MADLVVRQIRETSRARGEALAYRELLLQALAMLADRDRQLKSARETIDFQRVEIRALISGRTVAEQRQHEVAAA